MKITGLSCVRVTIPYRKPFVISGGPSIEGEHVLVAVHTDEGITGYGESAPMVSYSGETQSDSYFALVEYLGKAIEGADPFDFEKIHHAMEQVLPEHYFAKSAIDIALFDCIGKKLNISVYQMLGGKVRESIDIVGVIGIGSVEEMTEEAIGYANRGIRTIKLKIGNNPKKDIETVREVRKQIGPDVLIRVDANQGYDVSTAIRTIRKLEEYDIELVEQPVKKWDIQGMAKVTAAVDVPIEADESMFILHDAMNIIKHRAADIINIKILKPGGLFASKKVAALCEAEGITCLVGSMVEFGIGSVAGLHFAASTPSVQHACELVGPSLFQFDVICEDYSLDAYENGKLKVPSGPGLGVTLKDKYVQRLANL
jgi:muconate cycloisomerase